MRRRLRCGAFAAALLAIAPAASAETTGGGIAKILSPVIASCWTIVTPPEGERAVAFSVTFKLHPDGSLDGRPVSEKAPTTDYERMMIDSGIRAVLRCSPYSALVKSGFAYEDWKEITINFDPALTDL